MTAAGGPVTSSFALLRRGPFARLWYAGLLSSFGDWVALFATIALADSIGGVRGVLVPLAARLIPGLFAGVAGVIADRFDRRKVMIVSDVARAVLVLSLIFVTNLWQLFAVSFVLEALTLLWQPSREAWVPNLVPNGGMVAANSLTLVAAYGMLPVGALAFALLAKVGGIFSASGVIDGEVALAFAVDSLTFLASAALIATIPGPRPVPGQQRPAVRRVDLRAPLRDFVEGLRFVVAHPTVRGIILGMSAALFGAGAFFVLGQRFSITLLGAGRAGFGVLITALGCGVGLGMLALAIGGTLRGRREVLFAASLIATGAAITASATTSSVIPAAAWLFVGGLGAGGSYVMGFTYLHEEVEDELRGRTFAALYTVVRTSLLASVTLAGLAVPLLDGLLNPPLDSGLRLTLLAGGIIVFVAGITTLWAVRMTLQRPKLTETGYRALREAGDAFTSIRGKRRTPGDS